MWQSLFKTEGEHPFTFEGEQGSIEGICSVPEHFNTQYIAMLGHPHSLQGGTMNNKVVTTLMRAFRDLGIISIRTNFRGVGNTQGVYDNGIGESQDLIRITQNIQEFFPDMKPVFAGFSFGSYVTYRCAFSMDTALLLSIAPSVLHYDYAEKPVNCPWIMFHGIEDEIAPYSAVKQFVEKHPKIELIPFSETTHFFHGKLMQLRDTLTKVIEKELSL